MSLLNRRSFVASSAAFAAGAPDYVREIETWRREREAELRADGGWLSVAGLQWLEDGVGEEGLAPGLRFLLRGGVVSLTRDGQTRTLQSDKGGAKPDRVEAGSRTYTVIERGGRIGIRVRDSESRYRREFTGLTWYAVDPAARVTAKWRAYAKPEPRTIDSVGGIQQKLDAAGVAEFGWRGVRCQLEAFAEPDQLFFVFKDRTAGKATYPGGRFLYAPKSVGGTVTLDFNRAENPPCAFTPYATCPLAPKRNQLAVAIEAGEKSYHVRA